MNRLQKLSTWLNRGPWQGLLCTFLSLRMKPARPGRGLAEI
jgi:hypothetical protein